MNTENMNISTQQIQIFLKAVELKNFTQTANYFNYTPSMVSKTINALEDELGITLFVRKPHELSPTPAAKLLAEEWRHFIAALDNSIEKARAYENELRSRIVLGFVDSSDAMDQLIGGVIREYSASHPDIRILVEKHDMHRAAELLNSGLLDIIQTSNTEVPYLDEHGIPWEEVVETNVAAYVPKGNPLFNKDHIDFRDLRDQDILSLDPLMHPTYSQWMYRLCRENGFTPRVTATFRTVRSLLFSLKLMNAVFIGDSITASWQDENLKEFVLPETSFSLLAWRDDAEPELLEFKDFLKTKYPKQY